MCVKGCVAQIVKPFEATLWIYAKLTWLLTTSYNKCNQIQSSQSDFKNYQT